MTDLNKRNFFMRHKIVTAMGGMAIIASAASGCTSDASSDDSASTKPEASASEASTATKAPAATKPAEATTKPAEATTKPADAAIVTSSKSMIAVLESNALKAKNTYKGKRVTVSGFVGDIDASGKYFSLDPEKDAFIITGIQVQIDDKFKDQVANFNKGQKVTVTGEITDVGEILGYQLEAETIK